MPPVPQHQPSASIFPACLPPQPSSQANNQFHRPFADGLLSREWPTPAIPLCCISARKCPATGLLFSFLPYVAPLGASFWELHHVKRPGLSHEFHNAHGIRSSRGGGAECPRCDPGCCLSVRP